MYSSKDKKKILFVHMNMYSGGSQKSLISLLNSIDLKKYEIEVFLFRRDGLFLSEIPRGIKVTCPNEKIQEKLFITIHTGKELFKRKFYNLALKKSYYKLKNVIRKKILNKTPIIYVWKDVQKLFEDKKEHYDVAIAYSEGYPTFYIVDKIQADIKLAWLHAMSTRSDFYLDYYNKVNRIIAVSDTNLKSFTNAYPELEYKTMILKNIISSKLICGLANEKQFVFRRDKINLLTVARVAHMKGLDIAQEALNILVDRGLDVEWYVVGDCQNKHHMNQIIEKSRPNSRIIFLGEINNPYPLIKHCNIYVQPSRVEPYGLVVDEAIILNKPVVVTNISSFKERLENEKNAIFAEGNPKSLADSIERLIEDNILREKLECNTKYLDFDTSKEIEILYSIMENN